MSFNSDDKDKDYKNDHYADDDAAKMITVTNSNFHFRPDTGC